MFSELFVVSKETATANFARLSLTTVCKYFELTDPLFKTVFVFPMVI